MLRRAFALACLAWALTHYLTLGRSTRAQQFQRYLSLSCSAGSIMLVVEADGGILRFATRQLSSVEFISFRDDSPGDVSCGLFGKAFPALVPFRGTATPGPQTSNGTAVAVELLPDDFSQ